MDKLKPALIWTAARLCWLLSMLIHYPALWSMDLSRALMRLAVKLDPEMEG